MKRIFTLITAIALGFSAMVASTLSDIKSEIAKINGITYLDVTEENKAKEYGIDQCGLMMLTSEMLDQVEPILAKISDDLIFADLRDDEGTKVTIWTEPEVNSTKGEMLVYIKGNEKMLILYGQGDLDALEEGIQFDECIQID